MNPDLYYKQLAAELKGFEDQIRELKNKQLNGTDTIQTYLNQNPGWDLDWTVDLGGFLSDSKDYSVIFEADEQVAAINNMRYIILIDNTYYYRVASFEDAQHDHDVAVLGYVHDSFLSYAAIPPAPKKDGWYFNITAYRHGMNIKLKFLVDSTDTGTITPTLI